MRLFTVIALLTFSGSAFATDAKIFTGVTCQPNDSADAYLFSSTTGGIYNTGTTTLTVRCAVVVENTSSTEAVDTDFYAVDLNSSSNVTCTMRSLRLSTGAVDSSSASTSGISSSIQAVDMGAVGPGASASLWLTCTIPPVDDGLESGLLAYRVDEYTP